MDYILSSRISYYVSVHLAIAGFGQGTGATSNSSAGSMFGHMLALLTAALLSSEYTL